MTDQTPAFADAARDSLRARIEAAEHRNAERTLADNARAAVTAATDYTRAHPLTVIGGALAAGLAIGLLTRPGRRIARRVVGSASDAVSGAATNASAGVKTITTRGGLRLGALLGEAAVSYIRTLIDDTIETARAGQEQAGELGDNASAQARKLKDGAAENSRTLARKARTARTAAGRMARDLTGKTKG